MIRFQEKNRDSIPGGDFSGRRRVVVIFIMACMAILVGRALDLQVLNKQFLKDQGDMRHVSDVSISAYRGMVKDRNGAPLAISTPVESIWMNPHELDPTKNNEIRQMEKLLNLPKGKINDLVKADTHRQFAYIARQVSPVLADQLKALKLAGVYFERAFKRFYPTGDVSAHLVGFTDIDDVGQAGLEAGYERLLKGVPGSKRVIRDGQRRIIEDVENIKEPVAGRNLELSIDQRIQYLAYRELQLAFNQHKAKSAALVVLDAKSGEVLAAVNQPSFNPNTRKGLKESLYRNRALTDVFEPGSTVKPFVVAAALDGGYIKPNDMFETHGTLAVGRHLVKDVHNYGTLDLTGVLKKSSNVAVSEMALKMPPEYFWGIYNKLGFGVAAGSGFPGEANGSLLDYQRWRDFDRATLSFGYGLSASALQLARAYTALADNGILHSVSVLKRDEDVDQQRVFSAKTAKRVRAMMETVLMKDGTAYEARVDGYSAAGKTGTVKKAGAGGYVEKSYFSVFAGLAPAKNPRLIVVVMIDEPSAGQYYGGIVSAPVFSKVMAGALRVLEVAPDQQDNMPVLLTRQGL
ncbi:MAG: penicillin-binding transpeptidase domain-containing protein [Methylobacter sp.]|nr:penicillin-binding transpeptidase domain-containing protein [Methylobacter sp.]MDP2426741.1 penicillin-binding transpeptidase domain-containing protein [Methylobacter sp.]MDP3054709.1 penicillin-binding transpeptidase domain-containing protein [Methylobacter sp.]MDP3361761.1 penicillin-binding transpeptidase domain-containing protein [Methylobacter sp.]MDZ4219506.1 penicillin-binding transpeptidase domain-containing protein [Methylobacter sp.]